MFVYNAVAIRYCAPLAERLMPDGPTSPEAPWVQDIKDDVEARGVWANKDAEIMKRPLGYRKKKRKKPYVGAPNFVVPIIDDVVTDRTEQEVSMMLNAPHISNFISLSPCVTAASSTTRRATAGRR